MTTENCITKVSPHNCCHNRNCRHNILWKKLRLKHGKETDITHEFCNCTYFLDGKQHTLQDIAECWGMSRERIRQVEEKALIHFGNAARRMKFAELYESIDLLQAKIDKFDRKRNNKNESDRRARNKKRRKK